ALEYLIQNTISIESYLPFINTTKPNSKITPVTDEELGELELIKRPIRLKREYDGEELSCIIAPILLDGVIYGHITSWGYRTDNLQLDLSILEQASIFLSLEFLRLKVKHDVEQQYKNEFVQELLFNDSMSFQDLIKRGEKYRFSNERMYNCILFTVRFTDDKNENLDATKVNKIDYLIQQRWPEAIVGSIREYICVFFPIYD